MKGTFCCFVMALRIMSWVSATARPPALKDGLSSHQPGLSSKSLLVVSKPNEGSEAMNGEAEMASAEVSAINRGRSKMGSRPPNCEHKCFGCIPCEAIQVPTIARQRSRVGVQYTNYEPEGWKCKCGPSFYSP